MAKARAEIVGDAYIKIDELKEWFEEKEHVPDDDFTPFIAKWRVDIVPGGANAQSYEEDKIAFNCLFVTKQFVKNGLDRDNIHTDCTYKLNWKNYPLFIFGTSDRKKAFHPIAFALSKTETKDDFEFFFNGIKEIAHRLYNKELNFNVLISDAAAAIKNGFHEAFDGDEVTCAFHAEKNLNERPLQDQENRGKILDDILKLQLVPSAEAFKLGQKLLMSKYNEVEPDFVKYIQDNWFKKNQNWFEGFRHFTPSTNNCLESFNGKIKTNFECRDRPPLNEFKERIMNMLNILAIEYRDNIKAISDEVEISKQMWTKGYDWAKSKKNALELKEKRKKITHYFIPNKSRDVITQEEFKKYLKGKTFDEFIGNTLSIWKVSFPDGANNIKPVTCTCPDFYKNYLCKHVVGLGLRLQILKLPDFLKLAESGEKRGPGRQKRASRALQRL